MLNEQYDKNAQDLVKLSKVLSNSVAYKILVSLIQGPKSVVDIYLENKTPVSSTYKAIKDLQELGLILMQNIIMDNQGKRIAIYESKVKSLTVKLNEDGAHVQYDTVA